MLQGLFLLFSAAIILTNLDHRPRLRLPRPEGEHAVTDPTGGAFESARDSALAEAMAPLPPEGGSRSSIAWGRRRKSAGDVWREFWGSGQGKAGLDHPRGLRRDGVGRAAHRVERRARRHRRTRTTSRTRHRAGTSRSAPTTTGAASSRCSSGARGSACSSASPRRSSRSSSAPSSASSRATPVAAPKASSCGSPSGSS